VIHIYGSGPRPSRRFVRCSLKNRFHVMRDRARDAPTLTVPQLRRQPSLAAMTASSRLHSFGGLRERTSRGRAIRGARHEVRLIPPAYVKPFVKRQKNDTARKRLRKRRALHSIRCAAPTGGARARPPVLPSPTRAQPPPLHGPAISTRKAAAATTAIFAGGNKDCQLPIRCARELDLRSFHDGDGHSLRLRFEPTRQGAATRTGALRR
jgi:hypothetical protein